MLEKWRNKRGARLILLQGDHALVKPLPSQYITNHHGMPPGEHPWFKCSWRYQRVLVSASSFQAWLLQNRQSLLNWKPSTKYRSKPTCLRCLYQACAHLHWCHQLAIWCRLQYLWRQSLYAFLPGRPTAWIVFSLALLDLILALPVSPKHDWVSTPYRLLEDDTRYRSLCRTHSPTKPAPGYRTK